MDWKIGEIKQVNGEWYQCLEEKTCTCFGCDFRDYNCDDISLQRVKGSCQSERRKDNKSVIFKKLEKVGEPFALGCGKWMQKYTCFMMRSKPSNLYSYYDSNGKFINIEIK